MLQQNAHLPMIGWITFGITILAILGAIGIHIWERMRTPEEVSEPVNENNKEKKNYNPQIYGLNVENTFHILEVLISQQVAHHIEALRIKGPLHVNDKTYEKTMNIIINDIYAMISPDYMNVLLHYFSEEGLVKYLYRRIHPLVVEVSVQKNKLK